MTKKHTPSMYRSEVAVGFTVNIPDSVFEIPEGVQIIEQP